MANAEKITELIDEKALLNWDKFVASLDKAQSLMAQTAMQAAEINKAMGQSKSLAQFSKVTDDAAINHEKLRRAVAQADAAEQRLADARNRRAQADDRHARSEEARRKREEATARRLSGEYNRLDAELTKVRTRAQNVAAAMFRMEQAGRTNEKTYARLQRRYENMTRITQLLDGRLKQIDKTLGRSQRFVGEYERGFNGLANSINQLTREAPAFAVSFQTGVLALSNNIPILIDEINNLRASNAALAAQGKATIPVWRQLLTSFLSWQTAISLAITLLTVYGKEIGAYLSDLFGVRQAVDQARAAQEAYNEAVKSDEFKEAIQDVIELRAAVKLYHDGLVSGKDVVNRYNETLGETIGEVKTLEEVEASITKNAHAYIQMTLYKAAANIQLGKAAEMAAKLQEDSTSAASEFATAWDDIVAMVKTGDIGRLLAGQLVSTNAAYLNLIQQAGNMRRRAVLAQNEKDRDAFTANAEALLAEAAKYAQQIGAPLFSGRDDENAKKAKKEVDAELRLQQFRAQALAENNLRIVNDEKARFKDREDAASSFFTQSKRVIDLQLQMDLQMANNAAERQLAEEKASQARLELAEKDKDNLLAILTDELEKADKIRENYWADQKLRTEQQQHEEEQVLIASYLAREINEREYREKRKEIALRYTQEAIAVEIRALEELIKVQKARGVDVAAQERELARLKMQYSDAATKKQLEDLETLEEAEKKMADLKKQLVGEIFNLGTTLINANFQRQLDANAEETKILEERQERERQAIEMSTLSEEEKQRRIIAIEYKAEADRKRLDAERAVIQTKQARANKLAKIMEATMSTAAGVARAFADYPFLAAIPIASIIGALGAVQIATIAAQPIPQFFRGTEASPEGLARVGEKGVELIRYPDGTEALTPNKDTLTWLPKNTEVLTNEQTKRYLAKQAMAEKPAEHGSLYIARGLMENAAVTKRLLHAFENTKVYSTIITKAGWREQQNKNNTFRNYLNRNGIR